MKRFPNVMVDMDGVLCNLYGYAAKVHKVNSYRDINSDEWNKFFSETNAEELFENLEPFATNNFILNMVTELFGKYTILSSPLNFDKEGSIKGKKKWLKKYIDSQPNCIFDHEKHNYALQEDGTPNVLIDDYAQNVSRWNEAGGIAIKFQSDEDSVILLKNKLIEILQDFK